MWGLSLLSLVVLFIGSRVLAYVRARKIVGHVPGFTCLSSPISPLGAGLPTSGTFVNPGLRFPWNLRHSLYDKYPAQTFSVTPLLVGKPYVYTSHLAAFREVMAVNSAFVKPEMAQTDFRLLGINVVASEGEIWKRHRRITAPAFNQTTYQNVWQTTVGVYKDMLDKEKWAGADTAMIQNINILTHKLALFIIAICGFGIPMAWESSKRDERGRLSMQAMVFEVASSILIRSRTPKWIYSLGIPKLKLIDEAYNTFVAFMHERITNREVELSKLREAGDDITDGIRDVFGRLVNARLNEGKLALSDNEIIGNCFILVFAGHETTANTLSATLGLLAVYPEIQERVYSTIKKVLGDREPVYEDYEALDEVLACFYEGLRLYPSAYLMIREAQEDTVLSLPRRDNPAIVEKIPLQKGSRVVLDFIGINYDPAAFPDPERFDPGRWAASTDGFLGFSTGPRTCLGRKFATVEAVAFLTYLLRDWRVEPVLHSGETREQWRARVLDPVISVTLTFNDVPIKLIRRRD